MNPTTIHDVPAALPGRAEVPAEGLEAQELLAALAADAPGDGAAIRAGFDRLLRRVESLPLTTEEFGFAWNWIAAARDLWRRGEPGAARYQVEIVRKKLGL